MSKFKDIFEEIFSKDYKVKYSFNVRITRDEGEYAYKAEGFAPLTNDEVEQINSLEDLLATLSFKENKGRKVLDEEILEILKILTSQEKQKIADFIEVKDRIIITIDFIAGKEESIGMSINKIPNSSEISVIIRKNNYPIPGIFDEKIINSHIIKMKGE